MGNRQVLIESMVNKTVVVPFKMPNYNIKRVWRQKGAKFPIPFDVVEASLWERGFKYLIDQGILYISDLKDKQDLGLEPVEVKEPENIIVLNDMQIHALLKVKSFEDFKETIDNLNKVQVDNVINYAVAKELVDVEKCNYLKLISGKDILKDITRKREIAEAEQKATEKK